MCAGRGVCCLLSCGLIVYMLSRFQRGRVCVCTCAPVCVLWNYGPCIHQHFYCNFFPLSTLRGDIGAVIMCHELSRPISAPWPAPRREQKADLHRLMSGTVCNLTVHTKNERNVKPSEQLLKRCLVSIFPLWGTRHFKHLTASCLTSSISYTFV